MTPEELRALTEEGKAKQERKRQEREESERREREAEHQRILDRVPEWIRVVELHMREAAKNGEESTVAQVWREESWVRGREFVLPALEQVAEHFTERGFEARSLIKNETQYYSDGAGPGPDVYYVEVKW